MLSVIHCFDEYLPVTQNWVLRMVSAQRSLRRLVAARQFLADAPCTEDIECIRYPALVTTAQAFGGTSGRLVRVAGRWAYPTYVAHRLRSERVDVVHSHFAPTAWRFRHLPRSLNARHVVSFYGYDYEYLPRTQPVWRERYRRLFRDADLFICEGSHGARLLRESGCPEEKIAVVRLGVEPARIAVVHRKKSRGELKLLQIATFVEKKGQDQAYEAFLRARVSCPRLSLTFVGSDPFGLRAQLQARAAADGVVDDVRFLNAIDFSRLHEFMADYHAFIHPSRHSADGDCEGGAPVVLLDAQATGMPVIATTHCDIPEEVVHGRTGLLTPEGDVTALAESIRRLYDLNGEEYALFAQRARAHIEAGYDAELNAEQAAQRYRDLVSRL